MTATDAAGNAGSATIAITYLDTSNSSGVTVTLTPQGAIDQGAQWRINAGTWHNSGVTEPNVPAGPRFVDFINIPGGYRTPAGFSVNVAAGQNFTASGNYTQVFVAESPYDPSTPTPAQGTVNLSRVKPRFTWTGGAPSGEVEYLFCFDPGNPTSSDPAPYGSWSTAQSFPYTGTLLSATTYNWRVKTRANGITKDGPLWRFTTEYAVADLAVKNLALDGNVEPGANVTLSVTVTNQGNFLAPVANLYFYLSRQPGGKEIRLNRPNSLWINPPLQPGQFTNFTFVAKLDGLPAGQSFIDAWVDSTGASSTAESNFNNNLQSIQINYIDGKNPAVTYVGLANSSYVETRTYSIAYWAADDVAIKTMDFYYSTNGGLNWNPILEGYVPPTPTANGAGYPWLIPPGFPLTTNLQVKALARDTSGNWSEKTAGPYTVHDGTMPAVTLLSPNGGEVWGAGSSQQIRWNVTAANGIEGMNLNVYYGNSARFIANITGNTSGTYQWTVPSDLAFSDGRIRIFVNDNQGKDAADYSDNYFTIRDNSVIPPPWTTPRVLTAVNPSDPSGKAHRLPRVAVGSNGVIHAVYLYQRDNGLTPTMLYIQKNGANWSPPITITVTPAANLEITVDRQGLPHIVWETSNADSRYNDIFYSFFNGSGWASPLNISENVPGSGGQPTSSSGPRIAIDSADTAHVVWADRNSGGQPNIYYRRKEPSTGWSSIAQVTVNVGTLPAIAMDSMTIYTLFIKPIRGHSSICDSMARHGRQPQRWSRYQMVHPV